LGWAINLEKRLIDEDVKIGSDEVKVFSAKRILDEVLEKPVRKDDHTFWLSLTDERSELIAGAQPSVLESVEISAMQKPQTEMETDVDEILLNFNTVLSLNNSEAGGANKNPETVNMDPEPKEKNVFGRRGPKLQKLRGFMRWIMFGARAEKSAGKQLKEPQSLSEYGTISASPLLKKDEQ